MGLKIRFYNYGGRPMKAPELNSVIMDIRKALSQHPGPVKRVGIFGSLATGKLTDNSDIDIAIEYAQGDDFDFERFVHFCEVCEYISDSISNTYGRRVDLVHVEDNPRCLLQKIYEEVIWA